MSDKQAEYQAIAQGVTGRILQDIQYVVLSDSDDDFATSDLHCLDYGLNLVFDDGSLLGITWDASFYRYGVGLQAKSVRELVNDAKVVEMGRNPNWRSMVGEKIVTSRVFWETVEESSEVIITYPQDLQITFEGGDEVYLSAAKCLNNGGRLFGMADEIAVTFGSEAARRYGVGPYAKKFAR